MATRRTGGRVYERGGRHYIDFLDVRGRRVRRAVGRSREQAERALEQALVARAEELAEQASDEPGPEPTLQHVWSHAIGRARVESRPATQKAYRLANRKFAVLNRRKVHALKQRDIDAVADRLHRELKTSSANTIMRSFRAALNRAVRDGWLRKADIHFTVSLRRELRVMPRTIETAEFERLLKYAPNVHSRMAMLLGWYCGLRIGEARFLQWRDLDLEARVLRITPKLPEFSIKTMEERSVPLHARVVEELAVVAELPATKKSVWLMPGRMRGRPVDDASLDNWFRRARVRAGVNCTSHALRRTWATRMLASGVGVGVVMRLGGWSNLATLNSYIGLDRDAAVAAIDML